MSAKYTPIERQDVPSPMPPRTPARNVDEWPREVLGAAKKSPITARQHVLRSALNIELGGAGASLAIVIFGPMGVYFTDTGSIIITSYHHHNSIILTYYENNSIIIT